MILPERALSIAPGVGASLAVPEHAGSVAAIILPTDNLPRSGPGRLHAMLCRRLAAAGIPAMRIDSSDLDAEAAHPDVVRRDLPPDHESALAMEALERATGISRYLLIGTGSGAYGAFHAAQNDDRVAGIALINPHDFVGDPAWSAMVLIQRYLQRSSRSMRSWIKLVKGRADYRRILSTLSGRMLSWATGRDAVAKARAEAISESMLGLITRGCRVMFLLTDSHSSQDHTLALFGNLQHRDFESHTIRGVDHRLRAPRQRQEAIDLLMTWAASCSANPGHSNGVLEDLECDRSESQLTEDQRA